MAGSMQFNIKMNNTYINTSTTYARFNNEWTKFGKKPEVIVEASKEELQALIEELNLPANINKELDSPLFYKITNDLALPNLDPFYGSYNNRGYFMAIPLRDMNFKDSVIIYKGNLSSKLYSGFHIFPKGSNIKKKVENLNIIYLDDVISKSFSFAVSDLYGYTSTSNSITFNNCLISFTKVQYFLYNNGLGKYFTNSLIIGNTTNEYTNYNQVKSISTNSKFFLETSKEGKEIKAEINAYLDKSKYQSIEELKTYLWKKYLGIDYNPVQ